MKPLLRFVLHVEEFTDALFFPAQPAQIVPTTAFVKRQQERRIIRCYRAQTNRVRLNYSVIARDSNRSDRI